jgi:hypothetical protein
MYTIVSINDLTQITLTYSCLQKSETALIVAGDADSIAISVAAGHRSRRRGQMRPRSSLIVFHAIQLAWPCDSALPVWWSATAWVHFLADEQLLLIQFMVCYRWSLPCLSSKWFTAFYVLSRLRWKFVAPCVRVSKHLGCMHLWHIPICLLYLHANWNRQILNFCWWVLNFLELFTISHTSCGLKIDLVLQIYSIKELRPQEIKEIYTSFRFVIFNLLTL